MNATVTDLIDFDSATKDDLLDWAKENFPNEDLGDKRQSLASLASKCKKLAGVDDEDETESEEEEAPKNRPGRLPKVLPKHIKFLKHPENGRVFAATQELWKRGDMIAVDKDGNRVATVK